MYKCMKNDRSYQCSSVTVALGRKTLKKTASIKVYGAKNVLSYLKEAPILLWHNKQQHITQIWMGLIEWMQIWCWELKCFWKCASIPSIVNWAKELYELTRIAWWVYIVAVIDEQSNIGLLHVLKSIVRCNAGKLIFTWHAGELRKKFFFWA